MVSGSNRLSVSSDSAALPCHSRDRASSSLASRPPPRLTAARASRSPRVMLVKRDRIPGGDHQQLDVGCLVAVEGQLRQPDPLRRCAQRLVA